MKFKKLCFILLLFFIISFKVEANEVSCPYKETNFGEEITTIINLSDKSSLDPITIDNQTVNYGNNNSDIFLMNAPEKFFIDDSYITVQDYYGKMKNCPPYFYVYSFEGRYYGYFSDIAKVKLKSVADPSYSFESTAQEVEKDENGNYVVTDERYSCKLSSPFVENFELGVEINYTKKNIVFSSGTFENKDSYIKNFDYDTKRKIPDDLLVCYNYSTDVASRVYYIESKTDKIYATMPFYRCYDLSDSSEINTGTKGCEVYQNLIIKYQNAYSNKNYQEANSTLNNLKSFCNTQLMYANYDSYKYSCINLCLNISNDIPKIKFSSDGQCGFSGKLII